MGETAAKLRLIFDAVEWTRGVYLFDEVDALAGDRSSTNDVGEIRRVLNSFLQFLGATLVEPPRRGDKPSAASGSRRLPTIRSVVEYPLPTPEMHAP